MYVCTYICTVHGLGVLWNLHTVNPVKQICGPGLLHAVRGSRHQQLIWYYYITDIIAFVAPSVVYAYVY